MNESNCPRCGKEVKAFHDTDSTGDFHKECGPVELPVGNPVFDPISGKEIKPNGAAVTLGPKQKVSVYILASSLHLQDLAITSDAVHKMWPTQGLQAKLSGPKPSLNQIHNMMGTEEYILEMEKRGVSANPETLSAEQVAFLQVLTTAGKGGLSAKLQRAGIKESVWRSWLRQKQCSEAYSKLASHALKDAIPAAKVALAGNAANGDLASIKYLNELTGEYRPGQESQVDAGKMIQVVLHAVMNNISDPGILAAIQKDIQFQANSLNAATALAIGA